MQTINGLAVFESGSPKGKPIVFIHGFPFDHSLWEPQYHLFEKTYRVITYDVRGLGRSDVGDGKYSIELFVDDLIAVLDRLKIPKTVLCGHSMGGYIALRAMERNPERFTALILCDTKSQADSEEAKAKRAASIAALKTTGVSVYAKEFVKNVFCENTLIHYPDLVQKTVAVISANAVLGVCGALAAMAGRRDTTASLSKITVPTLILVGEQDTLTPPAVAEAMKKNIPKAVLALIPQAGHMASVENPEIFNQYLIKFLK